MRMEPRLGHSGFHRAEPNYLGPRRDFPVPDFDLWYVAAGAGAVRLDGEWQRFAAGDVLCLKPGTLYQQDRTELNHPFQVYFFHFDPYPTEEAALVSDLAATWPLRLSLAHRPELEGIARRLFEACVIRPPDGSLAGRGLLLEMLQIVSDELQRGIGGKPALHRGLLAARDFVEAHYAQPIRLADIAKAANLSVSQLSALFGRYYGLAPIEYLTTVRLREAKLLLARGLRVKEVALETGFASQHYFSRVFRQAIGLAPREFARLYHSRP
jgi:AraC-like DNA-binding protein